MADAKKLPLVTIVSGGQTGADRAGLRAAREMGLRTGGWMPKGFRTEEGADPETAQKYGLQEMPTTGYKERTMANANMGDATVAFLLVNEPAMGNGTRKTVGYCLHGKWCKPLHEEEWASMKAQHRPVLVIDASRWNVQANRDPLSGHWLEDAAALRAFVTRHAVTTLNVAGHREFAGGTWETTVFKFLLYALKQHVATAPRAEAPTAE